MNLSTIQALPSIRNHYSHLLIDHKTLGPTMWRSFGCSFSLVSRGFPAWCNIIVCNTRTYLTDHPVNENMLTRSGSNPQPRSHKVKHATYRSTEGSSQAKEKWSFDKVTSGVVVKGFEVQNPKKSYLRKRSTSINVHVKVRGRTLGHRGTS